MTENRLLEVAGHWLPRMEVAGIPSTLAREIIDAAGTWEHWCRAWSDEGARHAARAAEAEALGRRLTAGEGYARATLLYHFAQFMFFDDLEQKAAATERKLALYRQALPLLTPPGEPLRIAVPGGALSAVLRRPLNGAALGVALLIPGSDSTKEEFPALEEHFLRRGLMTVSLDGPGQGEGRALGPLRADISEAVQATIAHVRDVHGIALPVGLVGMAFGGHLALAAGGAHPAIEAVVSINGFHDLGAMWQSFPQVYRDNMCYALGASTLDDARMRASKFTLSRGERANVPTLVIHGGLDRIFPPEQAKLQAAWAAGELCVFPKGNHVCNNMAYVYRPLVADWLCEQVSR